MQLGSSILMRSPLRFRPWEHDGPHRAIDDKRLYPLLVLRYSRLAPSGPSWLDPQTDHSPVQRDTVQVHCNVSFGTTAGRRGGLGWAHGRCTPHADWGRAQRGTKIRLGGPLHVACALGVGNTRMLAPGRPEGLRPAAPAP